MVLFAGVVIQADSERADGSDEILAVVNAKPITYQEIVGDRDMQGDINTWRSIRQIPAEVSDAEIEKQLVFQRLRSFVLQVLLDAEADRAQLNITDAQMRSILRRERRGLGLEESDVKGWANYLKERFGMTPTEYREKRRGEIRRSEMLNYMAGLYGPLPKVWPVDVYFSLTVTPREVRREFEATRDEWRIARNIDHRVFKVLYPGDIGLDAKRKIVFTVADAENSVHQRVRNGESMERASDGVRKLIEDLSVPGVKLEVGERTTARDDIELSPTAYRMVLSVPQSGGVSEVGSIQEEDEDGQQLEGVMFVELFSREEGDLRDFKNPNVQESIRNQILNSRLVLNRAKVEQTLLEGAAIVPEHLFGR